MKWASLTEKDHRLDVFIEGEPAQWVVRVHKDGKLVSTHSFPMSHAPVFGPDVEDVALLEEKVDELLRGL